MKAKKRRRPVSKRAMKTEIRLLRRDNDLLAASYRKIVMSAIKDLSLKDAIVFVKTSTDMETIVASGLMRVGEFMEFFVKIRQAMTVKTGERT